MHRPDPDTDIDETLSALSDLVHAGKVRAIGSSTFPAESIVEARWVADRRGHVRFRSEQPPYSILVRGIEAAVLPTCERYGMGVIVWSPLAGRWMAAARAHRSGRPPPSAGRSLRRLGRPVPDAMKPDIHCVLNALDPGFHAVPEPVPQASMTLGCRHLLEHGDEPGQCPLLGN